MTTTVLFFMLVISSVVGFVLVKYHHQKKTITNLAKEIHRYQELLGKIRKSKYCHRIELRDTDENVEEIYLFTDDSYNPQVIYTHRQDIPQGLVLYL